MPQAHTGVEFSVVLLVLTAQSAGTAALHRRSTESWLSFFRAAPDKLDGAAQSGKFSLSLVPQGQVQGSWVGIPVQCPQMPPWGEEAAE